MKKPFVLQLDASRSGLGAVLCQEEDGHIRPVAYASRGLSKSERNYPAHKLEFLVLKWAVTERFKDYLYSARNTKVFTDNNPLTYVLISAKLDATGHRWVSELANYDLTIHYRPGRSNVNADVVSRLPEDVKEEDHTDLSYLEARLKDDVEQPDRVIGLDATNSVLMSMSATQNPQPADLHHEALIASLSPSAEAIPDDYEFPKVSNVSGQVNWRNAQKADPAIKKALSWAQAGRKPNIRVPNTPEERIFAREFPKLKLIRGLLHRVMKTQDGKTTYQFVLPESHRQDALRSLHDKHGHLGMDKTSSLVRARFFWPKMTQDIEKWVGKCRRYLARKTLPVRSAPLHSIQTTQPMELVCMDFLGLEMDARGFKSILVITDHFTRYAQAFPTKDQTARTVAKILWEKYFVHYGLPQRLHSDQGREFEGKVIKELAKLLDIKKSRTTPDHPQGDPQPERFNRTLLNMLGTLKEEEKADWSQHVASLVHAYNSTRTEKHRIQSVLPDVRTRGAAAYRCGI